MENSELKRIISGSLLISITIISIFSLVNKILQLLPLRASLSTKIGVLVTREALWLLVTAVIIELLYVYHKRETNENPLRDSYNCIIAGIFISLEGISNLSRSLPQVFNFILNNIKTMKDLAPNINEIYRYTMIIQIMSVLIVIVQILAGIYLVKTHKAKLRKEELI